MARQDQVCVDLVSDNEHPVAQADVRHLFQLVPRPHPAHRVVGIAQDQHGGILAAAQRLQQGKVDGIAAIRPQAHGTVQTAALQRLRRVQEGRIRRGHHHDAVSRPGEAADHPVHGAQHTVGVHHPPVRNVHAVAALHPAAEGGDVLPRRAGIAEHPALHEVLYALAQLRRRQKIHVRHGEGHDPPGHVGAARLHQLIFLRAGVPAIRQRGKIIGHGMFLLFPLCTPIVLIFPPVSSGKEKHRERRKNLLHFPVVCCIILTNTTG